ncbi:MAG: PKD domain-containing protein, partial [Caldilineaceae bacterium]|nr:PKD domain-containing protein [Caldilineaceae bacterium]
MRPILPPRFGLLFALLFAAVPIVFFGFTYMHGSVQAQDDAQVEDALVTADAGAVADGFDDLVIGIVNSTPIYVNETVTFSATMNIEGISGLTFRWQFGDGQSAEGRRVEHIYTRGGTYRARLFVISGSRQKETEKRVTAVPRPTPAVVPPEGVEIIILNADPNDLEAQEPVNFLATVEKGTNVQYTWDFGDGSSKVTGSSVTHTYERPSFGQRNGQYQVSVTAENSKDVDTTVKSVLIKNAPPEDLHFIYTPNPATIDAPVRFAAITSRGTNLQYRWEFSDGAPRDKDIVLEGGRVIIHPFDKPGRYEVNVAAWNDRGYLEYSQVVAINAAPPSDLLILQTGSQTPGDVPFFIQVRSQAPVTLNIRWGDRGKKVVKLPEQSPDDPIYRYTDKHLYPEALRYPFLITASNDYGTISASQIVYVGRTNPERKEVIHSYPRLIFPRIDIPFHIDEDVSQYNCGWLFTNPEARSGEDKEDSVSGEDITYQFTRTGGFVVTVDCKDSQNNIVRIEEFVIEVTYPTFLPLMNYINDTSGGLNPRQPIITPTATVIPEPSATATPQATLVEPTSTATATATATSVPATPTETVTATPTPIPATPTVTPTNTFVPTSPASSPP